MASGAFQATFSGINGFAHIVILCNRFKRAATSFAFEDIMTKQHYCSSIKLVINGCNWQNNQIIATCGQRARLQEFQKDK
jgi:hypothetical protein